jgi:hypothetical protein
MKEDIISERVPQIVWNTSPAVFCGFTYGSSSTYSGPHVELQRLALSTLANSGAIQSLSPQYLNSSYTLDFYAPSLQCDTLPITLSNTSLLTVGNLTSFVYYASAPKANLTTIEDLLHNLQNVPVQSNPLNYGTTGYDSGEGQFYYGLDMISTDGAKFYLVSNHYINAVQLLVLSSVGQNLALKCEAYTVY